MRGNQYKKHPIADRFWEKVKRGSIDECWPWTAYTREYGIFMIRKGRFAQAHRMAWQLERGPIPDGMCVCHRCDNPPCCNPHHFFLGTRADNNRDKVAKGRNVNPNASKTHCKRGHEFTPENITWNRGGKVRKCRACARERERLSRIRRNQSRQSHALP